MKIHEGKGHWMDLEDKVALPWMAKFTPQPGAGQGGLEADRRAVTTAPTGWRCRQGEARCDSLVIARREGQTIEVTAAEKVGKLLVRLDDRMVDLDRVVKIVHDGKELFTGMASRDHSGDAPDANRPQRPPARCSMPRSPPNCRPENDVCISTRLPYWSVSPLHRGVR